MGWWIFWRVGGWRLGIGQSSWERAKNPFKAAKNRDVQKLEDNIQQGSHFWHRKRSDFVSGFPEKAESVLKLDLLDKVACSNWKVGLWAFPGSPDEGAKIVHKVEVNATLFIVLKFLSFSPVSLVWRVHWASEFHEDALSRFTLGVKGQHIIRCLKNKKCQNEQGRRAQTPG